MAAVIMRLERAVSEPYFDKWTGIYTRTAYAFPNDEVSCILFFLDYTDISEL